MNALILTALTVGGATILGGAAGLVFKKTTKTFTDGVLSFAAGVMLAAAFVGLIIPSIESGGVIVAVIGIFIGALLVNLLDLLVPLTVRKEKNSYSDRLRRSKRYRYLGEWSDSSLRRYRSPSKSYSIYDRSPK